MLFVCLQIHTVNPESSPKKERRRSTKRFQKQSLTYCLFKMFFNVLIFVCLFWTRRERSKRLLSIKKISELKEKKSLDLFRSQRYRHISKRFPKVFYSDLFSGLQVSFFLQYLKDRDKGKYSMISGKKIKMKLKKSKKDKQVKYSKSMWFYVFDSLPPWLIFVFHSSGIKIEQNFWNFWTRPSEATANSANPLFFVVEDTFMKGKY